MSFRCPQLLICFVLATTSPCWVDADEAPVASDLWSLRPVVRSAIPTVGNNGWVANPIDRFVLARLEVHDMTPNVSASPRQLIRRLYLDIVGLPPTPEQVEAFLADDSVDAWEKVVDRLLANSHYGERWGRHWLDVVRYADTNGYEGDGVKPAVWRYRDYVIESLNVDKPYDRFVLEQLAGDELPDANEESIIGTGFYRIGPWDAERYASVQKSEVILERANELDDIVSTTSQVFLGLTIGCARCHDHKFDPLSIKDYYSLTAVFNPLRRSHDFRSELTLPAATAKQRRAKADADKRVDELLEPMGKLLEPLRIPFLKSGQSTLPEDVVAAFLTDKPGRTQKRLKIQHRAALYDELVSAASLSEWSETLPLTDEQRASIAATRDDIRMLQAPHKYVDAYYLHESSPDPPPTHILNRGDPFQPGREVDPRVPAVLASVYRPQYLEPDNWTTRRRLSLARWIASARNPLTARVIVNRVWQYHFGVGLVRTPSDFGKRGEKPTHPLLLDYLADWFVHEGAWSLKRLHRLVLTSSTYRMGKRSRPETANRDADNRLLWRFPYRRLEAEAIRDSMLAVSGQLNNRMFGPSMYPHISALIKKSKFSPDSGWPDLDEKETSRRTIYAFIKRTLLVPMLDVLDFCDTVRSADRRDITTVAPQALTLFNGEFVNRQARHFARRLVREVGDNADAQVLRAFRLALGRSPAATERADMLDFLQTERGERHGALTQMCRVLFNLNEFAYTD